MVKRGTGKLKHTPPERRNHRSAMRGPERLALHRNPENPVNPRLVALALALDPCQHIGIEANRQLLLCGRPCGRCFFEEFISERWNVGIVNRLGVQPSGLCRGELPGPLGVKPMPRLPLVPFEFQRLL